jgi:hypothetical protein
MKDIDLDSFDVFIVEPPLMAKQLCSEAIALANSLLVSCDPNEFRGTARDYISAVYSHSNLVSDEKLEKHIGILQNPFEFPAEIDYANQALADLAINAQESGDIPGDIVFGSDELQNQFVAVFVLFIVFSMKTIEEDFLQRDRDIDYPEVASALDPSIHILSQVIQTLKTLDPAREFLKNKLARAHGGKKGAQSRNKESEELKATVLAEFRENHAEKSAAQAARDIFEKLKGTSWLMNSKNKPISKDPTDLFKKWIRKEKKAGKDIGVPDKSGSS